MNQSNFLYGAATGPMDSAQVQAFAMAQEPLFAQLNQTLGIRLAPWQYRQLQSYFFKTETAYSKRRFRVL